MLILSEDQVRGLITPAMAFDACREAFIAVARGSDPSFPVFAARGSVEGTRVNLKYGVDRERKVAGVKIGTFWPSNEALGLPNHGATTLLLDDATGRPIALVAATLLNRYRTAAANAVATTALARADATTVALFGTGRQARYEVAALRDAGCLARLLVVGRTDAKAQAFIASLGSVDFAAETASTQHALEAADIVVTVTAGAAAFFDADDVKPGTHISAMGTDAAGKQELPPRLAARSRCFADQPSQSAAVGEFQHAVRDGILRASDIVAIGDVLSGAIAGRTSDDDITVFDSSGLAAQDLAVTARIVDAARNRGLGEDVRF